MWRVNKKAASQPFACPGKDEGDREDVIKMSDRADGNWQQEAGSFGGMWMERDLKEMWASDKEGRTLRARQKNQGRKQHSCLAITLAKS